LKKEKIVIGDSKMTVCIGCICNDEDAPLVIMSADRMITSSEHLAIQFEHPKEKICPITDLCFVAFAGNALMQHEIVNYVTTQINQVEDIQSLTIEEIVHYIQQTYVAIRRRQIEYEILKPRGIDNFDVFFDLQQKLLPNIVEDIQDEIDEYDLGVELLIGGIDYLGGHLYIVGNPGIFASFDPLGYAAIGSGRPHALSTFMIDEYDTDCSIAKAMLTTYKAKRVSEKTPGVGYKHTDMFVITDGGCHIQDESMIGFLEEQYTEMTQRVKQFEEEYEQQYGNKRDELESNEE
jgi:20S proteasome alpha/beta subunit